MVSETMYYELEGRNFCSKLEVITVRDKLLAYLFMIIAVPIAGELKFYPLDGDLRVSLGTPLFFFILLWSTKNILSNFGTTHRNCCSFISNIVYMEFQADSLQLLDPFYLYYPVFLLLFNLRITFLCFSKSHTFMKVHLSLVCLG